LLRVSDVGTDDRVKGELRLLRIAIRGGGQLVAVFLRSYSKLAADGILCLFDVGVDVVDVETAQGWGGRHGAGVEMEVGCDSGTCAGGLKGVKGREGQGSTRTTIRGSGHGDGVRPDGDEAVPMREI